MKTDFDKRLEELRVEAEKNQEDCVRVIQNTKERLKNSIENVSKKSKEVEGLLKRTREESLNRLKELEERPVATAGGGSGLFSSPPGKPRRIPTRTSLPQER